MKSTNTGRPWACSSATRATLQGSQPSRACTGSAGVSRSAGNVHAMPAASSTSDTAPKPQRALRPSDGAPSAHAAKASSTSVASSAAAPSMPACCPSTQTSQTTVANIGNAISVLKCAIHTPGRGSSRARPGQALASR